MAWLAVKIILKVVVMSINWQKIGSIGMQHHLYGYETV
jgi:hypothetical protein